MQWLTFSCLRRRFSILKSLLPVFVSAHNHWKTLTLEKYCTCWMRMLCYVMYDEVIEVSVALVWYTSPHILSVAGAGKQGHKQGNNQNSNYNMIALFPLAQNPRDSLLQHINWTCINKSLTDQTATQSLILNPNKSFYVIYVFRCVSSGAYMPTREAVASLLDLIKFPALTEM